MGARDVVYEDGRDTDAHGTSRGFIRETRHARDATSRSRSRARDATPRDARADSRARYFSPSNARVVAVERAGRETRARARIRDG